MLRYVQVDGRVYGPYAPEQLSAFLVPGTPVSRAADGPWRPAAEDAALADVLAGRVAPALEWYVHKGGEVRGPMARLALTAMARRGEILPTDAIRHADWPEFVPFASSRLFAELGEAPRSGRTAVGSADARIVFTPRSPVFSLRRHLRERSRLEWFIMLAAVLVFIGVALWAWRQSAESRAILWHNLRPPAGERPAGETP